MTVGKVSLLAASLTALFFSAAQALAETSQITVTALGETRSAAINNAIKDGLNQTYGAETFSTSSVSDDEFKVLSTTISKGEIVDYDVVEERKGLDQWRVTLDLALKENDKARSITRDLESWRERQHQTAQLDSAQKRIGGYRKILYKYRDGPGGQITQGYTFLLRGYEVDSINEHRLEGTIQVDVVANESWWKTYYDLVASMDPFASDTVQAGPTSEHEIDATLADNAPSSVPVVVEVGDAAQETITVGPYTGWHDGSKDCSTIGACQRIETIDIPFKVPNENALTQNLSEGVQVFLDH